MQIDRSIFESKKTKQKIGIFGIIRMGVFLFFAMFIWFWCFVRGFGGVSFDGFPKTVDFFCGRGEFVLGKSTIGEMMEMGAGFSLTTAERNMKLSVGAEYSVTLNCRGMNIVIFTVKNKTGSPAKIKDCTVMSIFISPYKDIDKVIRFNFPVNNNQWFVKQAAGKPDAVLDLGVSSEIWLYNAEWTGEAEYKLTFDRRKVKDITISVKQ